MAQALPHRIGEYRVRARLGSGGMGVVYLAADRHGRVVAVKVLRSELAGSPLFAARFGREIDAARMIDSAYAARLVSCDIDADPPWFASEYMPGPTLAAYVAREGPLRGETLRAFAAGVAEALATIGLVGLVHRDVKPANVLITPSGPKVIDFGVAFADDTTALTETGERVGTPTWMAPEQVSGEPVTPATDVFGWGALVAFAGTGSPPFGTGDPDAVQYRILHGSPSVDGLDPALARPVRRALAASPGDRPSMGSLLRELVDAEPDAPVESLRPLVRAMFDRAWTVAVVNDGAQPRGSNRRRRAMTVSLIALVGLAAMVAGAFAIAGNPTHGHRGPRQSAAAGTRATTITTTRATTTASIPASTTTFDAAGAFYAAKTFVHQQGCELIQSTDFSPQLNAVWCGLAGPGYRVYFFVGDRFVGTDTPRAHESPVSLTRSGSVIEVLYSNPNAPAQTPVPVRFALDGNAVEALDPIPPFASR